MEIAIFFSGKDKSQNLASLTKYKLLEFAKDKHITITNIEFVNVDKINIDKFLTKYNDVLTEIIFCSSNNMDKYFNMVSTKLSNKVIWKNDIILNKSLDFGCILTPKHNMTSIDKYLIDYIKETFFGGKSVFYLIDNFKLTYRKVNDFIIDYDKKLAFNKKLDAVVECKRLIAEKIKIVDIDINRLNQRKIELETLINTIK